MAFFQFSKQTNFARAMIKIINIKKEQFKLLNFFFKKGNMKYFLLIVGIFFNSTAKAEWVFAGEFNLGSGQVYEYYDNDLVKSGNIRKIWILRNIGLS